MQSVFENPAPICVYIIFELPELMNIEIPKQEIKDELMKGYEIVEQFFRFLTVPQWY